MSFIEGPHPLLESHSPAYSNSTVRRAFIVWMYCGQRNTFKDVCNYYHSLEKLEDKLPADRRAASRQHEFNMFSNPPSTSTFLNEIFPNLYIQNNAIEHYIKKIETTKNDSNLFKHEGLNDIKAQNGVTANEILDTSNIIKKYCKSREIPLRKFLAEFKEYAKICNLNYTVNNVAFYIKRKMVEEELLMIENYTKSLKFLNLNIIDNAHDPIFNTSQFKFSSIDNQNKQLNDLFANKQKQMTILTRSNSNQIDQYLKDFTSNFMEVGARYYNVTRT